ncbi:MAG: molybdopterin-guanine dinucleotide biosynthesis protein B [Candidatus Cloacimonadales bacterium]
MKVLSVAGYHHSGKTTLVVNIIRELKKRGYKVQSIKDIHYEDFSMETPASNSWKHWEASDDTVIARGLHETYKIWHRQLKLPEMLVEMSADYLIVEGMTSAALPRIICAKDENQLQELVNPTVMAVSGIYADQHEEYQNLPVYKSTSQISQIVDLIEAKTFEVLPQAEPECCSHCGFTCFEMVGKILSGEKNRQACVADSQARVELSVGGKEIKIVPFVQKILADTVEAIVRNLDNSERGDIVLKIRQK